MWPRQTPTKSQLSNRNEQGFTLLEILVYLFLFTILMSNLLPLQWQAAKTAIKLEQEWREQNLSEFAMAKLQWLLNDTVVTTPGPAETSNVLILASRETNNVLTSIRVEDERLKVSHQGLSYWLTPTNALVKDFLAYNNGTIISISFTINGHTYNTQKLK